MKVSVIVPVYNVYEYLSKCLDSLVNQTLKDIEIIVVNDGTKDDSESIIKKYLKKYKNIIYIKKENGGQGSARNEGIKHATGEYIGYVDSDDYIELSMYEKLYNKAIEENADIVICGSYNITGDKKEIEIDKKIFNDNKDAFLGKPAVWNKIYKKELITDDIKFRSKVWYEDLDFSIKVLSKAKNISFVDEPLYNYIVRQGSTMNNSNIDRNLEILDCFNEILNFNKTIDKDIIEFLAIDHIFISAIVRVLRSNGDTKKKKIIVNKLLDYMNNNFSNYKNNKYIKILPRNRKIVFYLLKFKLYGLVKFIFKIKES